MKNSEVMVLAALGLLIFNNTKNNFFSNLRYNLANVQLDALGLDGSFRIVVSLKIENNTGTNIDFEGFDGKVNYLNNHLTTVKNLDRVTLVQGETILRFNVPLTIKNIETVFGVSWSEFFRNFKDIIRPSNYSLHGKLYVRILGIRYTHEVNEKFVYS